MVWLSAAVAAGAVQVGVSDQQPAALTDPSLAWLGLRHARLIVPWDVAWRDPARVDAWLAEARAARMEPMVAFERRPEDPCPGPDCRPPTVADYRAAVAAFVARWPAVHTLTPWNEANHPSQPTATAPEHAAAYYETVTAACPRCTVVAADVLDSPAMEEWLTSFRASLDAVPGLWGLHNYSDVNHGVTRRTDAFLRAVPGRVWLTETGGIVALRQKDGYFVWPRDPERAARAVDYLFDLVEARSARIERVYFYSWLVGPDENFDAGFISPGGEPRPALDVLRRRLGLDRRAPASQPASRPPVTGGAAPPDPVAAPLGSPRRAAIAIGRVLRAPGGGLRVAVACAAAGRRCDGRLRATPVRRGRSRWRAGRFALAPGAARVVRLARGRGPRVRLGARVRIVAGSRVAVRPVRARTSA